MDSAHNFGSGIRVFKFFLQTLENDLNGRTIIGDHDVHRFDLSRGKTSKISKNEGSRVSQTN